MYCTEQGIYVQVLLFRLLHGESYLGSSSCLKVYKCFIVIQK